MGSEEWRVLLLEVLIGRCCKCQQGFGGSVILLIEG